MEHVYCLFIANSDEDMELHGLYRTREGAENGIKDYAYEFWDMFFDDEPANREAAWELFCADDNARNYRIEGWRVEE
jgi:hypothetical protein